MNLYEFLSSLRQLGIEITADGDRLVCRDPQAVLTPRLRLELTARKAEILAFLKENAGPPKRIPDIGRVLRGDVLPLSFAQQRIWFLEEMEGPSCVYNMPAAFRLRGPLSVMALERALGEMVRRHEILRTA